MAANTPLLTDASRLSAAQNVDNYAEGVAVHINGDWGQHYQFVVINSNWKDSCGNTIPGSSRLRIPLTVNGVDVNVVVPVVPFVPDATGDPPSIVSQPVDTSVGTGETARFYIEAAGAPLLQYQWYKDGRAISGANSAQFAVTNASVNSGGDYTCVVTNDFGLVQSNAAKLIVRFGQRNWHENSFWEDVVDFFDPVIPG